MHPTHLRSPRHLLALGLVALAVSLMGAAPACAAPFGYIDPVTPYGEIVNKTYQWMAWISVFILTVVEVGLVAALVKFRKRKGEERQPENWSHNTTLEIVWTVIPFIMLVIICIPTFEALFYLANVPKNPALTLEVVGHQFFWEYRYPELNATFSSQTRSAATRDLTPGSPEWDKLALYMPMNRKMTVKLTSSDVIHSWWVPAFGLQQMTTPANLAQVPLEITKPGNFEGACAYLCGPIHGEMDIKVKAVDDATFDTWVAAHKASSPIAPIAQVGKIGMVYERKKPGEGGEHGETPGTAPAAADLDPKVLAEKGKGLFTANCAGCHGAEGAGTPGMFPPLAGAEQVNGADDAFVDIVLKGKSGPITVKGQEYPGTIAMPAFPQLSDEDLAAITTYVRSNWGNNGKAIQPSAVKARR